MFKGYFKQNKLYNIFVVCDFAGSAFAKNISVSFHKLQTNKMKKKERERERWP